MIVDWVRNFIHNLNTIQLTSSIQEEGPRAPRNVLTQHHKNNCSNQPPKLDQLAAAALHQAKEQSRDDMDNPQKGDDDSEDQEPVRAACHSKSTGELKPDTMALSRRIRSRTFSVRLRPSPSVPIRSPPFYVK